MAATEIDIPDFLCSKKGEREDNGLSSEILEEKVKLEITSQVAETVNKQLETDVLTNKSGTFFQALSIPVVTTDDEGTPESCNASTTEDQIVASKENSQEDIREQKPEEGVNKTVESHVESEEQAVKSDKVIQSDDGKKEVFYSPSVKEVCEETISEKVEDKGEASKLYENEEKDKIEQITSSSSIETKENDEKLDGEAIVNDGQRKTSESPLVKEACEVTGSEKDEIQEGSKDTDSFITALNENELVSKEEKEQEVKMSEEVKGGGDDVISSQNASIVETEESEKCDNGEEEKREQSVNEIVESSSEIEQNEDNEEIKSSVETESQVSEQCENGEKDKIEQNASSSSFETKENEEKIDEVNEIESKEENQEKEVKVSEEVRGGEDDVISTLNASSENIEETTISQQTTTVEVEDKLSDAQEDKSEEKPEEIVSKEVESCSKIDQEEEDLEEIKPSVETKEKTEQQGLLHAVTTDDCITTQTESHVDTSEHEVKSNEVIQSDDDQKEIFNKLNENEITRKVEDQEKEKEEEVISSQDAGYEDIKESTIGQHVTSVAYFEENQPKEIINEETEEKSSDAQEACEEQKPEESVGEIVQPYSEIEQKEDTEEPKPSFETEEKTEQQELLHAAITDDVTTSQTESHVESAECEVKNGEAIESDDGQKKKFNSPLVNEVCEETGLEKVEFEEGLKLAESSNNMLNENEIASKIEDTEKEQEVYVSTSSQDATCEDIKETTISQHVTTVAYVDEEQALSSMPKEILKEEVENKSSDAQEETEQYENGEKDKRDQNPQESVDMIENTEEIKPNVETYETKEKVAITRHEEEAIESDDGQKENSKNLSIKEICEETGKQKVEFERVELSDKDENQEKEQEPVMSEQDQGNDTVRYSQNATSTEELQLTNYNGEGNEPEVVKTREYIAEDTEEIIYSVETKEMEEKIDEEAIVNDYGQTKKFESPLVKEVCEETDTKKVELEGVELSDKDENQEKKQEHVMSEQDKGEDTIIYSQDATSTKDLQVRKYVEDTAEVIYSVETKESEEKIDEEAMVNDYGQTKKSESPLVEEVCEVIGSENAGSEEGLTHFESSSRTLNQDEIISKEENQEKEQEPEEVQSGGDYVICSSKDIKETSDAHEDKTEQKPEESINRVLQSCSDIKQEEDTEEIKPSAEIEQQGSFHAIISQTESQIESAEHELKSDELIQSDDGQKEKVDNSLVDEVYEETDSKKFEYNEEVKETENENDIASKVEEVKSDEVKETANENDIARKVEEVKSDETIQSDDGQKENFDTSSVNEVCEEIDSKKVEYSEEVQETTNDSEIASKVEEVKTDEPIQSDDGQKEIVDSSLVNEVCDETVIEKVEYSEEVKETTIENEIVNKVEEVKSDEPIQTDDGQKENVDSSSINEVCKETDSQKVEYSQEVQETAKENEIASKVEEVKTDEPIQSDDGQKETVDSSSVNEVCEETDSKKVEYSQEVQATENENEIAGKVEEVKTDEPIQSDDGQKEIVDSSSVIEVSEETDSKKVEYSQEGQETVNENEIVSKVEKVKTDEPIQIDDDQKEIVVSSSVNEVCEETDSKKVEYTQEVQETTIENVIASKVEEVKTDNPIESDDGQKEIANSSSVNEVCEETDSKKVEYSEEVKETTNENDIASKVEEVKSDEPIQSDDDQKVNVDSSLVNEVCEETDSKKVEYDDEVKETSNENEIASKVEEVKSDEPIQSDDGQKETVDTSSVNEVCEETDSMKVAYSQEVKETTNENDIATDEPIQSDDGQKENVDSSLINEVCEETDSKKAEYSEEVKETTIENKIVNKVEDEEKEQEVYMPQDEKCEDIKEPKVGEHVTTQALSSIPKDIIKEETEEKSSDAQEEVFVSEQTESQKETMETEEKNEEFIESDDGQMEKTLIPSVNEVYEETTKEVCDESEEGVKAIETFKDEDQEKDQEVNKSIEGQGIDNVTSSQVAALEDDLQNESNQDKGKEPEFVETTESIEEDTEEIKSSVKTIEDTYVISTDVCSSTQIETMENEEKIDEEAIVNDDGQTEKSESLLVKEVCEVISSGKAESELNENEIVNKEEIQEKEQELKMSEEVKGVEDSNMKEECLPTITHVDEEKETETKEISCDEKTEQTTEIGENISLYVKEDVTQEDQTNSTEDCSEISKDVILTKEVQKGTDDLKEQIVEEDNHSTELQEKSTKDQKADVISYLDPLESDESSKQALKSVCDVQTPEVVADSEDSKVKEESIECTDEKNGEEEHEVTTNKISSTENLELVIEEDQVKETKPQLEQSKITSENIMENVILTEKDLADEKTTLNEKEIADEMSSELGQPKGKIVDEIQEGPTKTTSEIIEDEITKTDEILSHDTTTKDENFFEDERTRKIEPVEEHNDDLDEVLMQKSVDLNETTTEVKPQEDNVPSSSLVTSTEDTPNSEKPKAENDILPIEALESVYDEQIPEDSNLKEDCLTSATATYVDEEKETVTKEISSDEKTEQITDFDEGDSLYEKGDMKEVVTQENQLNSTEDCSQISKDVILTEEVPLLIQKEKETDDLKEQIVEEDSPSTEDQKEMAHVISYSDPIPVAISETIESKQVAEYPSISPLDAVPIEENLGLHGELKPTSESAIEEDQVKDTKCEQEQSDITSENIMKDASEKDLVYGKGDMEDDVTITPESQIENTENQNETIKNVILTDEVAVDTEKEKENNEVKEVKEQVSERDICPTELDKASTSNQKELADEIKDSKLIPSGNNEVKEVKAESPAELENIQAAETPETTLKMEMKEEHLEATNDTCETLMDGSLSEKKLESMVTPEELTFSTTEDQTNEPVQETEKTLEEDANKEKETVGEAHADEPMKSTSDSISSFTEQSIEVRSEECKDFADIHKLEEKPTEVYEIKSEVAEIGPEGDEVSETLPENVPEASPVMLLEKNDSETTTTIEKNTSEVAVIDVQKQERALDYTTEAIIVDEVSNEECSEIQQQHISKKEAILEENQSDQKKEADENIEREIPTEKENMELDAHASVTHSTAATEELEISQKDITDGIVKISQNQPEIQKYEGSACMVESPHQNERIERKLLTGNKDEQHEQKEPTEKPLIAEPESKASGTEPQCSSEVLKEEKKMSDEKVKSQTVLLDDMLHEQTKGNSEVAENLIEDREIAFTKEQEVNKEETGDKGAKTDEENEEEDDKDNQMIDDPVMVEASKDIDVKVHKKSHNILSGVGSKVKHSIAKVKKAITGKSSSPKPPSPKEKDQVIT